ncbi:hypothetical protein Mal52_27700 [Symmachiella dynata]|uniref:Peptidase A2 domain-containing protein n=1 Tax=Symmachiella dynata TaxID=2527995 RepID=A0A517ZPB5_9PLAN|nr:retropepsin-like aspartic protease [Symmachiella dynata]QDU44291.1 hypothetical protein Mal52_27700 [Symmachiella dynata]
MAAGNAQNRPQGDRQESNAYELWLGIPVGEQPPNFYRLLELTPLESDPALIGQAVKRCVSLVEPHLDGRNDRAAKKLLKQIDQVRQTLLSAPDKTRYDDKLRAKLSGSSDALSSASAERLILNIGRDDLNKARWLPEQLLALIAVSALGILAVSVAMVIFLSANEDETVAENRPPRTDPSNKLPKSGTAPREPGGSESSIDVPEIPLDGPVVPHPPAPPAEKRTPITDVVQDSKTENGQTGDPTVSEPNQSFSEPVLRTPATISGMKYPSRFKNVVSTIVLKPQEVLAERGVEVIDDRLVLREEIELKTLMDAMGELEDEMNRAQKAQKSLSGKIGSVDKTIQRLTGQMMRLNVQMRKLPPKAVLQNNQIVAEMNSVSGKRDLKIKDKIDLEANLDTARAKEVQARGAYIEQILKMNHLAEKIDAKYRQLIDDPEVQSSVAALNQKLGDDRKAALERSSELEEQLARVATLAASVLSEVIPIRRTRGNSLYVEATLNGKNTISMVLDSGASLVCLPHKVAVAVGVHTKDTDQKILIQIANGETIKGTAVVIPTMRVGKFTIRNVEAVIIGPEAPNTPTLLGMSFLRHFQFKIDPAANALKLISISSQTHEAKKNN